MSRGSPTLSLCVLALISSAAFGADFSTYRGFSIGESPASVAAMGSLSVSEVKTEHARPDLIQSMEWRPRTGSNSNSDSVQDGKVQFLNGKLYRVVVNYDPNKLEGMTASDLVVGISEIYGTATDPGGEVPYQSIYGGKTAPVLARWGDGEHRINLVQVDRRFGYALILTSLHLDELAQSAIAESIRLDAVEAPLRKQAEDARQAEAAAHRMQETRSENVTHFKP